MSDVRTSRSPPVPPAAVDRWDLELEENTLSSGDFEIKRKSDSPSKDEPRGEVTHVALMRCGSYAEVDLGEHFGVRSAISACRCVAMALRSARSNGKDQISELEPEEPRETPIGASYAEMYEVEILKRQSQMHPDQSHTHIRRAEDG